MHHAFNHFITSLQAISQSDVPLKNFFVYSALDTTGIVSNLPLTS